MVCGLWFVLFLSRSRGGAVVCGLCFLFEGLGVCDLRFVFVLRGLVSGCALREKFY